MKVSLNVVKQYADIGLSVDDLVAKINQQLGGVEEVTDLAKKYKDATVVKVVECEKHPNADRLSVCKIDAGTDELIQVVCGAPNVRTDMWAVWLPPESIVPSTFDDDAPFVLGARELRGVMSHGMLAASDELAIGNDHDGIVELTEQDVRGDATLEAGANFAKTFGLDDTVIDIENKMFTHRPDLFGQLGVAREIAGIQHNAFTSPDWYKNMPVFDDAAGLEISVFNDAADNVPRFMAVAIKNVKVRPSPMWLQCALVTMGAKPINNIVDATNYVMLLTAQPTHAYDYDKLRGHTLGARMAKKGERAELLNGKTYELDESDIVIVDGAGVVGVGGIMGGGNSEVSDETRNIVLEVANFNMYAVRKSSMRHGLFTDALTRFNKGQSSLQNPYVLSRLVQTIFEVAGGEQASSVFDEGGPREDFEAVSVTSKFINQRLGLELSTAEIRRLLENVELSDDETEEGWLHVRPAFWRTDIELPEDIVEEVGRLYGFDKLPRELPQRSMKPARKNDMRTMKQLVRDSLSSSGANEVLTYSFVHENVMRKADQDASQAFKLSNALSPDLQYYRLSVLPSLLDKVHMNIKAGHDEFVLYEIGKGHNKKYHLDDDMGLPAEMNFVDAVYAGKTTRNGAAYYQIRRMVDQLAHDLGFQLIYKPIDEALDFPVTAPFDQQRSALIETKDGIFIGMVGELKQSVIATFKLPSYSAATSLDLDGLMKAHSAAARTYQPLSRYPRVMQDLSLKVSRDTQYQQLYEVVQSAVQERATGIVATVTPLAVYQPADDSTVKTITFRVTATSFETTLTDGDVKALLDHAATKALEAVDAVLS